MDIKERVEAFKVECRSVRYLKRRRREIEEEIEKINRALTGIKSPTLDEPRVVSCNNKLVLIEKKDALNQELVSIRSRIEYVYNVLDLIPNKRDRALVKALWIDKVNYKALAYDYYYTPNNIYRKAERLVKRALKSKSG